MVEVVKAIAEILAGSPLKTALEVGGPTAVVLFFWYLHSRQQGKHFDRLIRAAEAREAIAFSALVNNTKALTALKTALETRWASINGKQREQRE